ncbi:C-type lectin Cal-like, partial [Nematolebias whitei]|uniref:C-type lectin Cal-like n=1 Tax=Nematolebias whitei TaxID=451745 RepID=UPI001897A5E7
NDSFLVENKHRDWCQALQYCRTHHADLASISNETHNEELKNKYRNKTFWIGLLHDNWKWADKSCSTYRTWMEDEPKHGCGIQMDGLALETFSCGQNKKVLCSKGSVRIIAVSRNSTWEEALNYCQANHTRLLWIEGPDDQDAVNQ